MLTLSTCSGSPASSFPGLRKAGRGAGNEATHSSGHMGELCKRFYAGLMRSVSCFMGSVSYSMKLISDSIRGCGRRVQNPLIFYSYNQL